MRRGGVPPVQPLRMGGGLTILLAAASLAGVTMVVANCARVTVVRRIIGATVLAAAVVACFDPPVGAVAAAMVAGLLIGGVERTERRREAALVRARVPFEQPCHVRALHAPGPMPALGERWRAERSPTS